MSYFGCKKRSFKSGIRTRQSEIVNDVVVKLKDKDLAQLYRGRHFQIKYYPETNSYRIKDLCVGFGTFLRIDKPMIIKDNTIVMLGDSFLILNLIPENPMGRRNDNEISLSQDKSSRLKVTVYAGPANGEMLYFNININSFIIVILVLQSKQLKLGV